jgi:F0F1-type ATP synthase alpha subunit
LDGNTQVPVVLTYAGVKEIQKKSENISVFVYADDMALASNNRELQKGFDAFADWAEGIDLKINHQKTELVVFRKGGRLAAGDDIHCKGMPLNKQNHCRYLNIIINLSLSTETFPDQLKITKVKPLYKKILDTYVRNYKPVTVH